MSFLSLYKTNSIDCQLFQPVAMAMLRREARTRNHLGYLVSERRHA